VCFDDLCWKRKWENYFGRLLAEAKQSDPEAENIIVPGALYNFPQFLQTLLEVEEGEKAIQFGGEEYRVFGWQECIELEDDEETDDAFKALVIRSYNPTPVMVMRMARDREGGEPREIKKKINLAEIMPTSIKDPWPSAEQAVNKAYENTNNLEEHIKERALEIFIQKKAESGKEPGLSYIDQFFKSSYHNDDLFKKLFLIYTGKKFGSFSKAFKENSAAAVFYLLRAATLTAYRMPSRGIMNDPEKMKKEDFIKFSGLAMEECQALYEEAAVELVKKALVEYTEGAGEAAAEGGGEEMPQKKKKRGRHERILAEAAGDEDDDPDEEEADIDTGMEEDEE
jgi:hypothetical protein